MAHSAIVGGSTAARLLGCPGSYQAILALPRTVETVSDYAGEGTAMHEVMARLMEARRIGDGQITTGDLEKLAGTYPGQPFYDRVLTREHLDTMILPALDALDDLEAAHGSGISPFKVVAVEEWVKFPGVPGASGTVDLILQSDRAVLHVDWKFGQGVSVQAVIRDGEDEYVNPQLMFYLVASKATLPGLYRTDSSLIVAVIQPRGTLPLTYARIHRNELRAFKQDVIRAVATALGPDAPRHRGEHCRFAPCKLTCPFWTGPVLDLSALGPAPARVAQVQTTKEVTDYGVYLSKAKALVDMLAMFKKTIDEQLHSYLEDGGKVPGWRLKAKAKQRQWVDETVVYDTLKGLGFSDTDIRVPRLTTFQAADATARRLGVKIPEELRVAPASNETVIAPTDDPAPVVERKLVIEQFQASLAALTREQTKA